MKKVLMQVMMKTLPAVMRIEALWFFCVLFVLLFFFGLCPEYFCTLKCSWLCLVCKLSFDCSANFVVLVSFVNFVAKKGE